MKHSRIFIIAIAALALAAAPVLAQQDAAQPSGKFLRCLAILGLSDTQKGDIRTILEAEKPVLQGLGQALKSDAAALKAALQATPPDPCAIGNALLKVHDDREAIRTELEKIKTSIEALLTPEQKAKLEGCLQAPHHTGASQAIFGDAVDGLD